MRGFDGGAAEFDLTVRTLTEARDAPGAAILDGILASDGIIDLIPSLAGKLVRRANDCGSPTRSTAVMAAPASRSGRTKSWGSSPTSSRSAGRWATATMLPAVMSRRELAARLSPGGEFLSSFGGNRVAMAAALAVLEMIEDGRIIEHTAEAGEYLAGRLRDVAGRTPLIGEVTAIGLTIDIEIARPGTTEPDAATTKEIVEGMRGRGVLIGTTGRHNNTLKIRSPLLIQRQHADQLIETLEGALESIPTG